jgi:cytochrome c biogenesis protein CcmG, thiol:disulfide interchange protein DsbE
MSKQWAVTATVVVALALGGAALTWVAPDNRVEINHPAPNFRAIDLRTRDSVSLDDYRGSVTLVNIWATWCLPCREEMPSMQKLYDSLKTRGFRIAAVSIDEGNAEDVAAFARQLKVNFDILHDRSAGIESLYQTTGVPESFLLDRRGILVKRVIGAHDWSSPANIGAVERLLSQPEE